MGAGDFVVDPKVLFDEHTQRFVITAIEVYFSRNEATIDIAVSDDSDPHGVWFKYRTNCVIRINNINYWVDYPSSGYDQRAFYVSGNLFGFSSGTAGTLFRIFDKAPMLVGNPVTVTDLRDPGTFSVQVAHAFGDPRAAYFTATGNGATMRVHAIRDPLGAPQLATANVTVPNYAVPQRFSVPNVGGMIDSLDGRVINAHWRDGNLYTGHPIFTGGRNVARWYHFDTANWPESGTPTLVQSGNVDAGPGLHTFFPAIFSDAGDNVGLVVAKAGSGQLATVEVTGRRANDPLGEMGALTEIKRSLGGYSGRYGDYFDICLDPAEPGRFWTIGQYANGPGNWGTWIGDFRVVVGGAPECEAVKAFNAKCKRNGKIIATVKLFDDSHNGQTVTFGIGGEPVEAAVRGNKAKAAKCCFPGRQLVTLDAPADCKPPVDLNCL